MAAVNVHVHFIFGHFFNSGRVWDPGSSVISKTGQTIPDGSSKVKRERLLCHSQSWHSSISDRTAIHPCLSKISATSLVFCHNGQSFSFSSENCSLLFSMFNKGGPFSPALVFFCHIFSVKPYWVIYGHSVNLLIKCLTYLSPHMQRNVKKKN